jgi:hypothetical protein
MRRILELELVGLILVGALLGYSTSANADACHDATIAVNTFMSKEMARVEAISAKRKQPGANLAAINGSPASARSASLISAVPQ